MLRHVPAQWSREAPFSACTDSAQSPAHRRTAPGLARLAPVDLFQKGSSQPLLVFGVTGCVGTMSSHELTAPSGVTSGNKPKPIATSIGALIPLDLQLF